MLYLEKEARFAQLTMRQSGTGRHNKEIVQWTHICYK